MKLLVDDARIDQIRELYDIYPLDGVTTNPTILSRAGNDPKAILKEIRDFLGEEGLLFAQVMGEKAEEMVEDAHVIIKLLGKNTVIKIPSIPEGFKTIKILKKEGIISCGTVVYSPMQALLAAKAGASYVAPYVNRIDNLGYDGVKTVKEIQDILDVHMLDCEVLGASFKNSQQVLELYEYGIESCTCPVDVLKNLVNNPAVDKAVSDFEDSFFKATGKRLMKDIL